MRSRNGGGTTPERMRAQNKMLAVDALLASGALSQADIARRTGLSRTTISSLVAELRAVGLVVEANSTRAAETGQAGRPGVLLALDDSAGAAVGIDFSHGHVRVAVANLSHTVLAERFEHLDVKADAHRSMDVAAALVRQVLAEAAVQPAQVLGAGMGLPGPIDRRRGMVGSPSILPAWFGISVVEQMRERLGYPVELDNESNLGALAEATWGAGRDCAQLAYVKADIGICAGIVIDGQLYRGADGTAGELGHMVVVENGDVCYCGNRGCLETLVGGAAIGEQLRHAHGERLSLEDIIVRATGGDLACQRALSDAGRQIGLALANYCKLINPRRLVIGGVMGLAGDLVLQPLAEELRRNSLQLSLNPVEVVPASLGARAEVLGAMALILRDADAQLATRLVQSFQEVVS